jgi:hypothetical protein
MGYFQLRNQRAPVVMFTITTRAMSITDDIAGGQRLRLHLNEYALEVPRETPMRKLLEKLGLSKWDSLTTMHRLQGVFFGAVLFTLAWVMFGCGSSNPFRGLAGGPNPDPGTPPAAAR